jgi:[acyl-carrier-protein] S-malonyltransferase
VSLGILFPGQGSQFVGMGAGLFEERPDLLGDRADAILGFSLRQICLEGPDDLLNRTEHTQPALFALSYALWDTLAPRLGIVPAGAAGHSLGEYTALTAAGAFGYETALGLVSLRGKAMAEAADLEPSGMAALLGADRETAEAVCGRRRDDGGRLNVANVNAPGQIVVAGGAADLEWLSEHGRDLGIRRVVPLTVAGAFHSPFMEPAAAAVTSALAGVTIGVPSFPVWANTTARPYQPNSIATELGHQVTQPVLFSDSLTDMAAHGIDCLVHVGPGEVTAGLARRTVEEARVVIVSDVKDIPAGIEAIGTMGVS